MTNNETKKEIINKINKSKTIYVHNGFTEFYFKTTKYDLLYIFRKTYKSLNESVKNKTSEKYYLDNYLEEFNNMIMINEENDLYFN